VEFLRKAFVTALDVLKPGCAFYVWFAQSQAENFLAAADKAGMTIRQTLIWAKSTFSLGRQDYQWKHEPEGRCLTPLVLRPQADHRAGIRETCAQRGASDHEAGAPHGL